MPLPGGILLAAAPSSADESPAETLPVFLLRNQVDTIHSSPGVVTSPTYKTATTSSRTDYKTGTTSERTDYKTGTTSKRTDYEKATTQQPEKPTYQAGSYLPSGGDSMTDTTGGGMGVYPGYYPVVGEEPRDGGAICHWILAAAIAAGLTAAGFLIKRKK